MFTLGAVVQIVGVRGEFSVVSEQNRKGQIEVARGALRMWVDVSRVQLAAKQEIKKSKASKKSKNEPVGPFIKTTGLASRRDSIRIDLHGLTVAQALEQLEKILDSALLEGAAALEVMHGLGSGALMKAVHAYLAGSKHVKSYSVSPGNPGVTIAYI